MPPRACCMRAPFPWLATLTEVKQTVQMARCLSSLSGMMYCESLSPFSSSSSLSHRGRNLHVYLVLLPFARFSFVGVLVTWVFSWLESCLSSSSWTSDQMSCEKFIVRLAELDMVQENGIIEPNLAMDQSQWLDNWSENWTICNMAWVSLKQLLILVLLCGEEAELDLKNFYKLSSALLADLWASQSSSYSTNNASWHLWTCFFKFVTEEGNPE